MRSTFGLFRLGARRQKLALNLLIGSSTIFAYSAYRSGRPILADGGQFHERWSSKPSIEPRDGVNQERSKNKTEARSDRQAPPPPQTQGHSVFDTEGDYYDDGLAAWQTATSRLASVTSSLIDFKFAQVRKSLTGMFIPTWVRSLPSWLEKLRNELSMAPWSLSWEIWEEAHDPEIHPEILWDAGVRLSQDLCREEQAFLINRRRRTARALAKYLGVAESEVHPEDVPTIAICGSGGGLRALVAGASSFLSTQEAGLFDCVTYSAGVSGSCWLQALYYSTIGRQNHADVIAHMKDRLGVHIAYPPVLLTSLSQSPTNKYLLSGFVEKLRGVPDADFGLVDVYGLALASRLLVPRGELRLSAQDLKLSSQRSYVDSGCAPLPIYAAVRHEIPASSGDELGEMAKSERFTKKHFDWFQWFEWTPYEFYSEELEAGIPTWAVGREWSAGKTVWRENGLALPELRLPLYLGIWGSAFCATLSHYYKEIRPIIKASGMSGLDALLAGKDDDLVKVHPIDPAVIPNFALGLDSQLPADCPKSLHSATHLQLMDAGMANNLPIYPLLRNERNVDVIVAFDASADVEGDNWIKVVDGYARRRRIKTWPMGAGWPPRENSDQETASEMKKAQSAAKKGQEASGCGVENDSQKTRVQASLGHCTVWVGSREEHEYMDETPADDSKIADDDQRLRSPDAGIAVIYFPFVANDKVPGVDPLKADFMSTWNFIYTPEQIDKVVQLARANFEEGKDQTRRTIRAVWERKRAQRLQKEKAARDSSRRTRMRTGGAAMRRNGDVGHGDHFGGGI